MGVSNRWMDYELEQWNGLWTAIRTDIYFVPRLFERDTTTNKTCRMLQYKLKPVKTTVIRLPDLHTRVFCNDQKLQSC